MNSNDQVGESVGFGDSVKGEIIRGKSSWDYIYVTLGFALTIEAQSFK